MLADTNEDSTSNPKIFSSTRCNTTYIRVG